MRPFNLSLIAALILVSFLNSCRKKPEDSPFPSGRYRIKCVTIDKNNFKGRTNLSYNAKNEVIKLTTIEDATGEIVLTESYKYNTSGLKTMYKSTSSTNITTYKYEYNGNNLLTTKYSYSGTDLNNPVETVSYYYDSNNNMVKRVLENLSSYEYRDSSIFSEFINGRPSLKTVYTANGFFTPITYTLQRKEKYTYDERMNLTLLEMTKGSDINTYYNSSESIYRPFSSEMNKVYAPIQAAYDQTEYGLKNDKDFMTNQQTYWEQSCNTVYGPSIHSNETKIIILNSANLFSKTTSSYDTYDGCGNVISNVTNTNNYIYELY